MRIKSFGILLAIGWAIALAACCETSAAQPPNTLKIGVAQVALEATLAANRDKIVGLVHQAKEHGCRVVVFPETALYCPLNTPPSEIDAAVEALRQVVDASDLYALIGGLYQRNEKEKPYERLLV